MQGTQVVQQIAFAIILGAAIVWFRKNILQLRRNIFLGRKSQSFDNKSERWRLLVLNALGQRKMFSKPIPAILHLFVYIGFVLINIEILEIIIDGLTGQHRIFLPLLGGKVYAGIISFFEFLAVLVLVGVVVFWIRRNVLSIPRFKSVELTGWPFKDANNILYIEVVLMLALLVMNATDLNLQKLDPSHYHATGNFLISGLLSGMFSGLSMGTLVGIERFTWWFHIIGILLFLNYLPFSKHLHIILSFPNTWYSKLKPMGIAENMPEIQKEVQMMLFPEMATTNESTTDAPMRFGAKDITDLEWTDILGAYSCTECGRCTAECPANQTGKKLSPRKIMMDVRDRAEEVGVLKAKGNNEEIEKKSLLGDYITKEELLACNTCQACVQACPVNINPLNIIIQMRRYVVMEEADTPSQWNVMFQNSENNQAPWQFSPSDRLNWASELN